jgi:nucleotide-binding universal stress UspA family protein
VRLRRGDRCPLARWPTALPGQPAIPHHRGLADPVGRAAIGRTMPAIVVGVDASADAAAALRWAAAEARSTSASLVVVHAYWVPLAYPRDDFSVARIDPEFRGRAEAALDALLDAAGAELDGIHVVPRLHPGRAADALLVQTDTADLLVLGRRGTGGFEGLLLGSTAGHCARHATCPVVVVPSDGKAAPERVVVGLDGSLQAEQALDWALDLAARRGARVDAVGVYEPYRASMPFGREFMQLASPDSDRRLRQRADQAVTRALAQARVSGDVEVQRSVEAGNPAKVLVDRSRDADLVVVGSRGLGGFSGLLLGSVGRQLLHHAACPVAVVRS